MIEAAAKREQSISAHSRTRRGGVVPPQADESDRMSPHATGYEQDMEIAVRRLTIPLLSRTPRGCVRKPEAAQGFASLTTSLRSSARSSGVILLMFLIGATAFAFLSTGALPL